MCGIVGCVSRGRDVVGVLLDGLETLEFRGYDSAGIAAANGTVEVVKGEGDVDALRERIDRGGRDPGGHVGIGHTRWATHGSTSDVNAHPHTDGSGEVAVVHNGIVENHRSLREELIDRGCTFESDTDTEVIPHLIARERDGRTDPEAAFRAAVDRLEGSYAVAAVVAGADSVFAARNDSPLVVGVDDGAHYLASNVSAFLEHTGNLVSLDDGQFAVLDPDGWRVTDGAGRPVDAAVSAVDWDPEAVTLAGHDHFTHKEIHEQPTAIRDCLAGRVEELRGRGELAELGGLATPETVHLVACGTSYHAALYGATLFRRAGIPARATLASEYATDPPPTRAGTLVVGVTQSGETADTLAALREAGSRGVPTLALTNVVESTATRECDHALSLRAGPEVGVAATKTFTAQQVALNLLVDHAAGNCRDRRARLDALCRLPDDVQRILDGSTVDEVVDAYVDREGYFFVGRGQDYPVALEGALKFKEVTYEHAEGLAAGELKHGTLALVTGETPVLAVVTGDGDRARRTLANVEEVRARNAPVVAVTDGRTDVARYADHVLEVPETHPQVAPVLAAVQLQLLAYHVADRLGRPIDRPRHLAKSVTVQ